MILQIESFGTSAIQTFGAFGFVVIFMFIVIYVQNQEKKELKDEIKHAHDRNNEISDKTIELITRVSDKMPSLERLSNLERNQTDILEKIKEVITKMEK